MKTLDKPCWENGFTIPGQEGWMDRVMELARLWGADAIRNSDGTDLPPSVADAGYDIYSNVYLIRKDNAWIKAHPHVVQQVFKTSPFVQATEAHGHSGLRIDLMAQDSRELFKPNPGPDALPHWQVFDRTTGDLLAADRWQVDESGEQVTVLNPEPWHVYSANFLAWNIWEVINHYNYITNGWNDEPELAMDPIYPEVREHIRENLAAWLSAHPYVNVVRFTTFYYNSHGGGFCDYSHTVSPRALALFEEKYGYRPTAESFIRAGAYNHLSRIPDQTYRDWIAFVHDLVIDITRDYVDMVHQAGKKAVFLFGDQWIGCEPYSPRFAELGMDGAIKAVFSGYETRIVTDLTTVPVKEVRFHPYFFPREVTGKPTFSEGGTPLADLRLYWRDVRRACMRACVNRVGFGGMISMLEGYPDFVQYVAELSQQAHSLTALHLAGRPWTAPVKVAVLTEWGRLRSWLYSGHMMHNSIYNQFLEALSGLPFEVSFLSFEEVATGGVPEDVGVVINCGREGTAFSGGERWRNPALTAAICRFVAAGGGLIGIGEPSACPANGRRFQLAPVLGIDRESLLTETNYRYPPTRDHFITSDLSGPLDLLGETQNLVCVSPKAEVIASRAGSDCEHFYTYTYPQVVAHPFHQGRSVYFAGFKYNPLNTRTLARAIMWAGGQDEAWPTWQSRNPLLECAWFPASKTLAVANLSETTVQDTVFLDEGRELTVSLEPLGLSLIRP